MDSLINIWLILKSNSNMENTAADKKWNSAGVTDRYNAKK